MSFNWLLAPDSLPAEEVLALQFMEYLLMGTDAAPLAKALYDRWVDRGVWQALVPFLKFLWCFVECFCRLAARVAAGILHVGCCSFVDPTICGIRKVGGVVLL